MVITPHLSSIVLSVFFGIVLLSSTIFSGLSSLDHSSTTIFSLSSILSSNLVLAQQADQTFDNQNLTQAGNASFSSNGSGSNTTIVDTVTPVNTPTTNATANRTTLPNLLASDTQEQEEVGGDEAGGDEDQGDADVEEGSSSAPGDEQQSPPESPVVPQQPGQFPPEQFPPEQFPPEQFLPPGQLPPGQLPNLQEPEPPQIEVLNRTVPTPGTPPTLPPTETMPPTEATQSYSNTAKDIELQYSSNWMLTEDPDTGIITIQPQIVPGGGEETAIVTILREDDPKASTLEQYHQDALKTIRDAGATNVVETNFNLPGNPPILAKKIEYDCGPGCILTEGDTKNMEVYTIINGKAYRLNYNASPEQYSTRIPDVNSLLSSLKIMGVTGGGGGGVTGGGGGGVTGGGGGGVTGGGGGGVTGVITAPPDCRPQSITVSLGPSTMESGGAMLLAAVEPCIITDGTVILNLPRVDCCPIQLVAANIQGGQTTQSAIVPMQQGQTSYTLYADLSEQIIGSDLSTGNPVTLNGNINALLLRNSGGQIVELDADSGATVNMVLFREDTQRLLTP